MSSNSICECQKESDFFDDLSGSYTKTDISGIPALICIYCGNCVAVKNGKKFTNLEKLLEDKTVLKDGWQLARGENDIFKHKLLNFAVYRINEPPNKDNFECNYR